MSTLYASFRDLATAERAAGALLDQGARPEDISVIANEGYAGVRSDIAQVDAMHAEKAAKDGISVTTPADAAMGAAKGLTVGVGVGIAAAIASLAIPGVGIVLGAGALATALGAAAATAAAGAAVGGVVGYLKDQGLDEATVTRYSQAFSSGGTILALAIPTGKLDSAQAEGIINKYGAGDVCTYASNHNTLDRVDMPTQKILVIEGNENVDPIGITQVWPAVPTSDPLDTLAPKVLASDVRPTVIDPITGQALEGFATDPITGLDRPVRFANGHFVYVV